MIHFLDYYHPYAGLCNQLYLITNHIHDAYSKGVKIFIHKINIDIFKKERVFANEVLDIEKTNKNLKKLLGIDILGIDILVLNFPDIIDYIPKLCIYPVSSIEILNCLEFHGSIIKNVESIKSQISFSTFNGIHFRLDIDAILHYTFGKEVYDKFMDFANIDLRLAEEYFKLLDETKIEKYCLFLMKQYFTFITHFGFEKTWYISSSITKYDIHKPMKIYLKQLVDFITNHGGSYYIPSKIYQQRELNALVDLLILRDSEKMIGFEGSSFSEGYCLKVNSIRKITKEYLFLKEYF